VQFDTSVNCKEKGKESRYKLTDLKAIGKQLKIPNWNKLNKEELCNAIKAKILGATQPPKPPTPKPPTPRPPTPKPPTPKPRTPKPPTPKPPTPKPPTPKPPTPAASSTTTPLGYVKDSDLVKIRGKPNPLVFDMNTDCATGKNSSSKYKKENYTDFVDALGIKRKRKNSDMCEDIKTEIRKRYSKAVPEAPLPATPSLSSSSSSKKQLTEAQLIEAIRKCLKLTN
jgi:hypothetical protein